MSLSIKSIRVKILKLSITLFFCFIFTCSNKGQSTTFIDIDDFSFAKAGVKSGLRVCVFDIKEQKYTSINYYNFPTTANRRPQGELPLKLNEFSINYSGDVKIGSSLSDVIVRTTGKINATTNGLHIYTDEQAKNIAFKSVTLLSASDLKKTLGQFQKGKYGKTSFKVTFYNFPSWSSEEVNFGQLSQDAQENNQQRKIIGELATRMSLFGYGFREKIPTQDNSGQNMDGAYIQRNNNNGVVALFLTESKCMDESLSPQKIMESQLDEKSLYDNIGRLATPHKDFILGFISSSPTLVFKAAHRILIDGCSEWLVKPLNLNGFRTLSMGIASPEKDKEAFIESIATNFKSPEEMLRVIFAYYKADNDNKKLAIFLKALNHSTENFDQLVLTVKEEIGETKKARPPIYDLLSPDPTQEAVNLNFANTTLKQEINNDRVTQPTNAATQINVPTGEAVNIRIPAAAQQEELEAKKRVVKETKYNRQNLAKFLTFIKEGCKRNYCTEINAELQRVNSKWSLTASELSKLSNFETYPNFQKTYNHESLWNDLSQAFNARYQQALAEKIFD